MSIEYTNKINRHYSRDNLFESIIDAIKSAGIELSNLTREHIGSFEEFHIGGRDATHYLAKFADLKSGSHILDIGCGVGGPARTLADEYGCHVTGIDVTKEYIHTARELSRLVGLADKLDFQVANGTKLSFDNDTFDIVWMQHVNMNIAEKDLLFTEINRVLKPNGQFIFYEVIKQNDVPLQFPVLWAMTQDMSHLIPVDEYKELLKNSGFKEMKWEDRTQFALDWYDHLSDRKKRAEKNKLNLSQIIHTDIPQKVQNVLFNLKENRISVVQGLYQNL
ncbi:MAG: class I SAM-dependent methyltransferase [Calditrichaeota bacterium]|nr:MAG: class I SAM-dependent methyltransferase [Calditrichota bacterium]